MQPPLDCDATPPGTAPRVAVGTTTLLDLTGAECNNTTRGKIHRLVRGTPPSLGTIPKTHPLGHVMMNVACEEGEGSRHPIYRC